MNEWFNASCLHLSHNMTWGVSSLWPPLSAQKSIRFLSVFVSIIVVVYACCIWERRRHVLPLTSFVSPEINPPSTADQPLTATLAKKGTKGGQSGPKMSKFRHFWQQTWEYMIFYSSILNKLFLCNYLLNYKLQILCKLSSESENFRAKKIWQIPCLDRGGHLGYQPRHQ